MEVKSRQEEMSRKEAIAKGGKYAAVTAAALFTILSPLKAQEESPPTPGW